MSAAVSKTPPIIAFEGVEFAYEGADPVLRDVNLDLEAGGFYLLTGPSGAGKSTLLRLISRLEEPTAGCVWFQGRRLTEHDPPRLRRALLNVQQTPALLDASVRHNLRLAFGFRANADLTAPSDEALRARLAEVNLDDVRLTDNARSLSVGQQQRLCLLRGLMLAPEVMLLDEPTSALDAESADLVDAAVVRLHRERGLTVLLASHRGHPPAGITPRRLRVADGRVSEVDA